MSNVEPYMDENTGLVMVPRRAETPDGGTVGMAWVPLEPDNPMYDDWVQYLQLDRPDWAARVAGSG